MGCVTQHTFFRMVGTRCPTRYASSNWPLYGHPEAGTLWERHCKVRLGQTVFVHVDNWAGCFVHASRNVVLVVYVGDFEMTGDVNDLENTWGLIASAVGKVRVSK